MFKANANVSITHNGEEGEDAGVFINIVVNKVFNTGGDGLWSEVAKEVFVTSMGMYVGLNSDDGEFYYDGDFAVNYTEETWDNEVDGLIYTDELFIAQVREYMIAQGFNADAVNDISYSEQGMQDDERVSCDAYKFAEYVRSIVAETV
jgi:hypothetical protein